MFQKNREVIVVGIHGDETAPLEMNYPKGQIEIEVVANDTIGITKTAMDFDVNGLKRKPIIKLKQ